MTGLIRRVPLAFFSFLEVLLQGPADETHDKKDDILMFMMFEEFMKNCRNAEVSTESYVERIVPAMSDSSFCQHFRLSKLTAQRLVNILVTNLRSCPSSLYSDAAKEGMIHLLSRQIVCSKTRFCFFL